MSSAALAAVLAKLAGLNVAGKVVVGVAVAAGAASAAGGPAIASHLAETPETAQVQPTVAPTPAVPDASTFGQWVAKDARDGGVDGEEISAAAHAKNALRRATKNHPTDLPDASAFGQKVAKDARDGGVDGKDVSAAAHAKNALKRAVKSHPKDSATTEPGAATAKEAKPSPGHGMADKADKAEQDG